MLFDDLEFRYGPYAAEMIRQALTIEEFEKYEVEELIPFFELKAERHYEEYRSRLLGVEAEAEVAATTPVETLVILRRRWQQTEEMAAFVLDAERQASEKEVRARPLSG